MSDYPYNFSAKIVRYDFGKVVFSVVYVPKEIVSLLDFSKSKRLRIDGEIEGIRIEGALMPTKGKWYLMVSKKLQKLCGVTLGDRVQVSFDIGNQDAITVPNELQFALEANDAARKVWDDWTAGKRRGFCYRVASAKMPETRTRRVEETIDFLLAEKENTMTEAEKASLIDWLDSHVMSAVPRAIKIAKYGGTLYTLKPDEKEGQFCGVFPYKTHVQLSFAHGSDLDDPDGLLEGGGKFRRHLTFKRLDDVDAKAVKRFVKAASKIGAE
ncbi:hypothetical protein Pla52o_15130 [Novipirellula galeiformis]|uniref:YdhG-like domain-containing protein n=1 Tax=Novipirellula galeiformis TaxID=2528004 RepID=A0A5C6CMC0_9BACT|nr:YdeI/OmpD-associated family protein [Novipirellula galeiformis]TWU25215.1 hypothetical protein Pla52o_15130 [Novipirellula galeiformis]